VHAPSQDKFGGLRQEGHPAQKWGHKGDGSLISPAGVAPSRIVDVSASDISSCTIKSRGSFLLAPAHLGGPGERALKRLCVYVCGFFSGVALGSAGSSKREPLLKIEAGSFYKLDALCITKPTACKPSDGRCYDSANSSDDFDIKALICLSLSL